MVSAEAPPSTSELVTASVKGVDWPAMNRVLEAATANWYCGVVNAAPLIVTSNAPLVRLRVAFLLPGSDSVLSPSEAKVKFEPASDEPAVLYNNNW